MANESGQGTGKHAHKKASEPYPHTKDEAGSSGGERKTASREGQQDDDQQPKSRGGQQGSGGGQDGGGDDLKAREYTDAQGNVHHHTKAYMEQQKGG